LVDLEPGPQCEERFDLELYRHRGVDLVEWDEQTDRCQGRRIRVRYLPNRIGKAELTREVERCALKANPESTPEDNHARRVGGQPAAK